MPQVASRIQQFNESMIREMTRLAMKYDAINLSQGFPDFPTPEPVLKAATEAIQSGLNQYTVTWGYPPLRERLAEQYTRRLGWEVNPDEHIVVTCGVTEAIVAALLGVLNPGDEVLIPEPAHENFRPAAFFAGGVPVAVPLTEPDFRLDPDRLRTAISPRTRALILNTPHNPSGRVFDEEEIAGVVDVVTRYDLVLITDEIYDRILFDGREHVSPGSLEPLRERTITTSGFSKTFAVTGWRLGFAIAPQPLMNAMRAVHDFLTICAATPLQAGAVAAFDLPDSYYEEMLEAYHRRRQVMYDILTELGFRLSLPEGAYYMLADYSQIPIPQAQLDPLEFARWLTKEARVAAVPGRHFYSLPGHGQRHVRFAFPKQIATLEEAGERMRAAFATG